MISDENENQFYQFLIFLIVYYLIDPDFIKLYQKKNFDQFHLNAIFETYSQNYSQNRELFVIWKLFKLIRNLCKIPFKIIYSLPWFLFLFENWFGRGRGKGGGGGATRTTTSLFCKIVYNLLITYPILSHYCHVNFNY